MIKKIIILTDPRNKEVTFTDYEDINRDELSKEFIDLIGELNNRFNSNLWWATTISSKNQFISPLYKNIYTFFQIINTIEKSDEEKITIFLENERIAKQLSKYCNSKSIKIKIHKSKLKKIIGSFVRLKELLKNTNRFLITNWQKKYLASKYFKKMVIENVHKEKSYYILRAWIDNRSFDEKDSYVNDPYFGKLPQFLTQKEKLIVLVGVINNFEKNLKKIKKNLSKQMIIIPQEYFMRTIDLLRILFRLFRINSSEFKDIKFQGIDITYLIAGEIQDNKYSGELLWNSLQYYLVKNLTKTIKCKTFTYTFENHSWEKMMVLALRRYSQKTEIIGYQHSSIVKKLFNFFLSTKELNIIPLPDKIVTVGRRSREIMTSIGNFPKDKLREGCALRYEYLFKDDLKSRSKNKTILAAFSIGTKESVQFLNFLIDSLKEDSSITVLIKCHPLMPMEKILQEGRLKLPNNFKNITDESIGDLLDSVDIFVYTETTVCMEALMKGIPSVFLDIDKFYCSDPLFECNYLKWSVSREKDLLKTIFKIYSLKNDEFNSQQTLARQYMKDYFFPVTQKNLMEFIKL